MFLKRFFPTCYDRFSFVIFCSNIILFYILPSSACTVCPVCKYSPCVCFCMLLDTYLTFVTLCPVMHNLKRVHFNGVFLT